MNNQRHSGRARRDDGNRFDFSSPEGRPAAGRSASHRYFPVEEKTANHGSNARQAEEFPAQEFKARWWPAPDVRM